MWQSTFRGKNANKINCLHFGVRASRSSRGDRCAVRHLNNETIKLVHASRREIKFSSTVNIDLFFHRICPDAYVRRWCALCTYARTDWQTDWMHTHTHTRGTVVAIASQIIPNGVTRNVSAWQTRKCEGVVLPTVMPCCRTHCSCATVQYTIVESVVHCDIVDEPPDATRLDVVVVLGE